MSDIPPSNVLPHTDAPANEPATAEAAQQSLADLVNGQLAKSGHDIASAAKALGLSSMTLKKVAAGESFPNKKTLPIFAQWLNRSEAELLTLKLPRKGRSRGRPAGSGSSSRGKVPATTLKIDEDGNLLLPVEVTVLGKTKKFSSLGEAVSHLQEQERHIVDAIRNLGG